MADPINIKFPLRHGAQGAFATNDDTLAAVADDLTILLLSNFGERPIHSDFGANLRDIIFEQGIDLKQQVEDNIRVAVDKWMPFVTVGEVDVRTSEDDRNLRPNQIHVKINFFVGQLQGVLNRQIAA